MDKVKENNLPYDLPVRYFPDFFIAFVRASHENVVIYSTIACIHRNKKNRTLITCNAHFISRWNPDETQS